MGDQKRTRRQFTFEDKAEAVRRHVVIGEAVSAVCEDLGVALNLFYRWQRELFDHAAAAFEVRGRGWRPNGKARQLEKRVESLEARLAHKDNVIAEITQEYVAPKKSWRGLIDAWTEPDVRVEGVDFVSSLHGKTDIAQGKLVRWLGLARSKF